MDAAAALANLARTQWGVFSRAQALDAGMSISGIHRRLTSGDWVEVSRRVYRHAGGSLSWRQLAKAATLSLGSQALASHSSAAWLWGLDGVGRRTPRVIEVTLPMSIRLTTDHVSIHHSRLMPRPDYRHGIPVMPIARTLLDLADVLDEQNLEIALDSAMRQYRGTLRDVRRELARDTGRSGAQLLAALADIREGRTTDSPLEVEADRMLRLFGMALPTTGHVVRDRNGKFVARLDRQTGRIGDGFHATPTKDVGLNSGPQPARPLAQRRTKFLELLTDARPRVHFRL
jgi:hypothetical protein